MERDDREDEFKARQDGRVYPVGEALRSTYDADNHETLGSDVTGLMIDLSKVPYERTVPIPPASPAMPPADIRSWMSRIGEVIGGRRASS